MGVINVSDNIISSLGFTTEENFNAVVEGRSGSRHYEHLFGLPDPCHVALVDRERVHRELPDEQYTLLEKMAILSVKGALSQPKGVPDPASSDVIFVLSTTKGNIEMLQQEPGEFDYDKPEYDRIVLSESARRIAKYFQNPNTPVVVSNACISGVVAQIVASRMLESGQFRYAIVVGVDVLSRFIISGFQSFKALSPELCKPFDKDRIGLNLGEAAATLILKRKERHDAGFSILGTGINNDANHISGPSRTAEGLYRSILKAMKVKPEVSFINAHGTATPYNDDMESIALSRAGLNPIPTYSLKGYFGHTLGAAGVLETIISLHALENNIILSSLGTEHPGTAEQVNVALEKQHTPGTAFLKTMSGFGGCNAAIAWGKDLTDDSHNDRQSFPFARITADVCESYRMPTFTRDTDSDTPWLTQIYKRLNLQYPKFYKMDDLSKAGFLAAEMLIDEPHDQPKERWGILMLSHYGCMENDCKYQHTINDPDNYYPAPSNFVYTLPNIVTGEIAIRHHIYGETVCYMDAPKNEWQFRSLVNDTFAHGDIDTLLCGWIDNFRGAPCVYMARLTRDELPFITIENLKNTFVWNY